MHRLFSLLTGCGSVFLSPVVLAAAPPPDVMATGKAAFAACMACHGTDGMGAPAGPSKMAPPLAKSAIVTGDPAVLTLAVMKGITKESQTYLAAMAPMDAMFSGNDEKFAALLTYLRNSFGNEAPAVSAEDVAKYRAKWIDERGPVKRERIKELEEAANAEKK